MNTQRTIALFRDGPTMRYLPLVRFRLGVDQVATAGKLYTYWRR
jgi:hypothetical protein